MKLLKGKRADQKEQLHIHQKKIKNEPDKELDYIIH